jgi:hypothetical protein
MNLMEVNLDKLWGVTYGKNINPWGQDHLGWRGMPRYHPLGVGTKRRRKWISFRIMEVILDKLWSEVLPMEEHKSMRTGSPGTVGKELYHPLCLRPKGMRKWISVTYHGSEIGQVMRCYIWEEHKSMRTLSLGTVGKELNHPLGVATKRMRTWNESHLWSWKWIWTSYEVLSMGRTQINEDKIIRYS